MTSAMKLGDLIDLLECLPQDLPVRFAHQPTHDTFLYPDESIDSWRGVYSHLALGHTTQPGATVRGVVARLRLALGAEFTGYKGGDYIGNRDQQVFVDNCGESGGPGVIGVGVFATAFDQQRAVIFTSGVETTW